MLFQAEEVGVYLTSLLRSIDFSEFPFLQIYPDFVNWTYPR